MKHLVVLAVAVLAATPSYGQLAERNQVGLTMGHVHLLARDVEAQTRFWTSMMGGTLVKNGPIELIRFPGVFIMITKADAPAAPAGGIVNHVGFIVKDMKAALARWQSAGMKIEPTENPNEVYVLAPDGVRVEVYGEPALPTPIAMNHVHFYPPDIPGIRTWYVRAFGANPGRRPCVGCISAPRMIETGELPGVNLSFSITPAALAGMPAQPTKGRAIDHIGFDVEQLEPFVASLEAKGIHLDGPVRQVPNTRVKVAFLTDPWGTRIELTEGLSPE